MSIKILMPALSPTMKEGNLAKWLIKKGDKVKAGDVIAEIETDKATMELEAVDEGTISKILVKEGTEGVAVNSPIAVLNGSIELAESPKSKEYIKVPAKTISTIYFPNFNFPLPCLVKCDIFSPSLFSNKCNSSLNVIFEKVFSAWKPIL